MVLFQQQTKEEDEYKEEKDEFNVEKKTSIQQQTKEEDEFKEDKNEFKEEKQINMSVEEFTLNLPHELSEKILQFLSPWDLCQFSRVCIQYRQVANTDRLWYVQ